MITQKTEKLRLIPYLNRKFRDVRYAMFYGLFLRKGYEVETLGNRATECAWTFCPVGLNKSSVVYSAGVGKDITFEHSLVERYGCSIVLLDPSPTGLETMALLGNQIPEFNFFPLALTNHEGEMTIAPPGNAEEGSWFASNVNNEGIKVASTDLQSLMRKNAHTAIDLLKLDIEGSEYEVIDDFLKKKLLVRQLCVEFHHSMPALPDIRRSQSIRAILQLAVHGYKLIYLYGSNHTFLKT